jgi:hypothetical protein
MESGKTIIMMMTTTQCLIKRILRDVIEVHVRPDCVRMLTKAFKFDTTSEDLGHWAT